MVGACADEGVQLHRGPIDADSLDVILNDLRPADRKEVEAILGADFQPAAKARFLADGSDGFIARRHAASTPLAVCWWMETHPGRYAVAMLARPYWLGIARALSREMRRTVIPQLVARGLAQATCLSAIDHATAHRWLDWLGFERCGHIPGYGRHGEDFLLFSFNAPPLDL